MLEGKEAVIGQECCILVAIDGKNAAFMFGTMGFGQWNKFVEATELRSGNISLFSPVIKHHLEKDKPRGIYPSLPLASELLPEKTVDPHGIFPFLN